MKDDIQRVLGIFHKPRESIAEIRTLEVGKQGVAFALLTAGIFTSIYSFFFGMALVNPMLPIDSDLLPFAIILIAVVLFIMSIMFIAFTWIICSAASHLLLRAQGCTGDFDTFYTGNGYALIVFVVQPVIGMLLLMILGPSDILFSYDLISSIVVRIWFGIIVALSMKENYNSTWKQITIAIIIALVITALYPIIPQYLSFSFLPPG